MDVIVVACMNEGVTVNKKKEKAIIQNSEEKQGAEGPKIQKLYNKFVMFIPGIPWRQAVDFLSSIINFVLKIPNLESYNSFWKNHWGLSESVVHSRRRQWCSCTIRRSVRRCGEQRVVSGSFKLREFAWASIETRSWANGGFSRQSFRSDAFRVFSMLNDNPTTGKSRESSTTKKQDQKNRADNKKCSNRSKDNESNWPTERRRGRFEHDLGSFQNLDVLECVKSLNLNLSESYGNESWL